MDFQTNKMGKELGKKIFPSPFTLSYFIIIVALAALTAITVLFSLGLFLLGEFISGGWLNALAILALAAEVWMLVSLIMSAINALKIRKFENARVERVSLFCMHLDVIAKIFMVMGIIVTVLCFIYSCVWFCSAFDILPKFVDFMGSVINGIFGWNLDLENPDVVTPLMNTIAFAKGSPVLAIILSIILPVVAGAMTYFGFDTLKKTIRAYESMHVDGNAPPSKAPVILLFVFGGLFVVLGLFLTVFFFTRLGEPSVFTNIFTTAKENAFDKIYEGLEKTLGNFTKEKNEGLMVTISDGILKFVGETMKEPLTFVLKALISVLSVVRYIAFVAFDLSLTVFGGYLVTKAVMFTTLSSDSTATAATATAAPTAEEATEE